VPNWQKILLISLSWLAYVAIGYFITRDQFDLLFSTYAFTFGLFLLLFAKAQTFSFRQIILLAVLFRAALWMTFPQLSDDIFRFVWDGRLILEGVNPYLIMPMESLQNEAVMNAGLDGDIFKLLNSKQYYTIYPPVNQFFFAASSWLGNGSIFGEVIAMRVLLMMADIGALVLGAQILRQLGRSTTWLLGYALNPLVIIEITANLHFEGVVIFFLVLAIWLWLRGNKWMSALVFGLAISTKLLPLIFLPLLIRPMGWKNVMAYGSIAGLSVVLTFLPFLSVDLLANIWSSIDLYFQSFEFNASVYYLLREVGDWITGYNLVRYLGPGLSLIVLVFAIWLAAKKEIALGGLFGKALLLISAYFLLSTTVHPWYMITVLAVGMMAQKTWVIPWTFLCFISYSHYDGGGFEENYLLIAIEYALLGISIWMIEKRGAPLLKRFT
jgi:alpha-1,6-mannosyltransferase